MKSPDKPDNESNYAVAKGMITVSQAFLFGIGCVWKI